MRTLLRLMAAALTGVILAACFPGFGEIGELVWIALMPLLATIWTVQGKREKRRLFVLGWLSGTVFFLINLKWLWTVSGLGSMALSIFLGLYWGLWAIFAGKIANPWRMEKWKGKKEGILAQGLWSLRFASLIAVSWVAQEWLRGIILTGFGWNGMGVAFAQTPVLAQGAELLGVTGLSFFPAFFAAVLLQVIVRMRDELGRGKLATRLDFGFAVLMIAILFAYGTWRIDTVREWNKRSVRVLLMQRNIPQSLKWDSGEADRIYKDYRIGMEEAFAKLETENKKAIQNAKEGEVFQFKDPELVIWPESSVSEALFFDENDGYLWGFKNGNYFANEIMPIGEFVLLTGVNQFEVESQADGYIRKEGGSLYNSMVAVGPEAEVQAVYRKNHLVPFGEYIPLREQIPLLDWFFKFSAGVDFGGNFSSGGSHEPIMVQVQSGEISLIPSVCFEDTVGRLLRKFIRKDAQMIVNVTNDGWFLKSEAARQQLANAVFRCIELRRPMARAANTGVSAMIDMTGGLEKRVAGKFEKRIIQDAETGSHFVKGSYYGNIEMPTDAPMTFYARFGDVFSYACVMISAVILLFGRFFGFVEKTQKK